MISNEFTIRATAAMDSNHVRVAEGTLLQLAFSLSFLLFEISRYDTTKMHICCIDKCDIVRMRLSSNNYGQS